MSQRMQRRAWIANFMFRLCGGGYERPSVPKLPRIQLPPPATTGRRPVRLGIAGLLAIAGRPDMLEVLVGLKPAPVPLNGVHREAAFGGHFVEESAMDVEATLVQESFCRRPNPEDSYYRVVRRSWKRYRSAQYRPRLVSAAA